MQFQLNIDIKPLPKKIGYADKILLMGSCFTEHIGNALEELKFQTLQNPNGILFDPLSVSKSLISYTKNTEYSTDDLFQLDDVWHSWQHHSRYSNFLPKESCRKINASQKRASEFLKNADWIIITLGSSFSYRLSAESVGAKAAGPKMIGEGVANCHRAPAQWFQKRLMEIDEIIKMMVNCMDIVLSFNPKINFLFTVSPVRHIRDGVVDNNRSKSRLIESVHHLVAKYDQAHYFPAYEIVIDVLRDYRFYDVDMVHPNYLATEYVLEKFGESCLNPESRELMEEIRKIVIARKHKAFQPQSAPHRQFLLSHLDKTKLLKERHPFLDLESELKYFSEESI